MSNETPDLQPDLPTFAILLTAFALFQPDEFSSSTQKLLLVTQTLLDPSPASIPWTCWMHHPLLWVPSQLLILVLIQLH